MSKQKLLNKFEQAKEEFRFNSGVMLTAKCYGSNPQSFIEPLEDHNLAYLFTKICEIFDEKHEAANREQFLEIIITILHKHGFYAPENMLLEPVKKEYQLKIIEIFEKINNLPNIANEIKEILVETYQEVKDYPRSQESMIIGQRVQYFVMFLENEMAKYKYRKKLSDMLVNAALSNGSLPKLDPETIRDIFAVLIVDNNLNLLPEDNPLHIYNRVPVNVDSYELSESEARAMANEIISYHFDPAKFYQRLDILNPSKTLITLVQDFSKQIQYDLQNTPLLIDFEMVDVKGLTKRFLDNINYIQKFYNLNYEIFSFSQTNEPARPLSQILQDLRQLNQLDIDSDLKKELKLQNLNFSNKDLSNCDLTGFELKNINVENADLKNITIDEDSLFSLHNIDLAQNVNIEFNPNFIKRFAGLIEHLNKFSIKSELIQTLCKKRDDLKFGLLITDGPTQAEGDKQFYNILEQFGSQTTSLINQSLKLLEACPSSSQVLLAKNMFHDLLALQGKIDNRLSSIKMSQLGNIRDLYISIFNATLKTNEFLLHYCQYLNEPLPEIKIQHFLNVDMDMNRLGDLYNELPAINKLFDLGSIDKNHELGIFEDNSVFAKLKRIFTKPSSETAYNVQKALNDKELLELYEKAKSEDPKAALDSLVRIAKKQKALTHKLDESYREHGLLELSNNIQTLVCKIKLSENNDPNYFIGLVEMLEFQRNLLDKVCDDKHFLMRKIDNFFRQTEYVTLYNFNKKFEKDFIKNNKSWFNFSFLNKIKLEDTMQYVWLFASKETKRLLSQEKPVTKIKPVEPSFAELFADIRDLPLPPRPPAPSKLERFWEDICACLKAFVDFVNFVVAEVLEFFKAKPAKNPLFDTVQLEPNSVELMNTTPEVNAAKSYHSNEVEKPAELLSKVTEEVNKMTKFNIGSYSQDRFEFSKIGNISLIPYMREFSKTQCYILEHNGQDVSEDQLSKLHYLLKSQLNIENWFAYYYENMRDVPINRAAHMELSFPASGMNKVLEKLGADVRLELDKLTPKLLISNPIVTTNDLQSSEISCC